jgi:hypothetical protein
MDKHKLIATTRALENIMKAISLSKSRFVVGLVVASLSTSTGVWARDAVPVYAYGRKADLIVVDDRGGSRRFDLSSANPLKPEEMTQWCRFAVEDASINPDAQGAVASVLILRQMAGHSGFYCRLVEIDLNTRTVAPLTELRRGFIVSPQRSPDGTRLAYAEDRTVTIIGPNRETRSLSLASEIRWVRWAPDGGLLYAFLVDDERDQIAEIAPAGEVRYIPVRGINTLWGRISRITKPTFAGHPGLPDNPAVRALLGNPASPVAAPQHRGDVVYAYVWREGWLPKTWIESHDFRTGRTRTLTTLWRGIYTE